MKCPHCKKEVPLRTGSQNSALWVFFGLLAESLNDAGLDIRKTLKSDFNIPWTKYTVHDLLWLKFQKSLFKTESTKELSKHEQITLTHKTLMRELGERKGVEYIPFPNNPNKQKQDIAPLKTTIDYPWNKERPKF